MTKLLLWIYFGFGLVCDDEHNCPSHESDCTQFVSDGLVLTLGDQNTFWPCFLLDVEVYTTL